MTEKEIMELTSIRTVIRNMISFNYYRGMFNFDQSMALSNVLLNLDYILQNKENK